MSKNIINNKSIEIMRELASRKGKMLKNNKGIINFNMLEPYRTIRDIFSIEYTDDILQIHLDNEEFCKVVKNKTMYIYTDEADFIYYYNKNKKVLFFTIKD